MKNLKHKDYTKKNPLLDLAGSMSEQEANDFLNSIYDDEKYNKQCAKCKRQLYDHYPDLRSQFPILNTQLNGHNLIYLDSAATSQKPQEVIDAMTDFYSTQNASSHSVHSLGGKVTELVEQTRQVVADFVGAKYEEIVFTSGATEGLNLVANGFLEVSLKSLNNVAATTMLPLLAMETTPLSFTPVVTPVSLEAASPLSRGNLGLTKSHTGIGSFASLKMTDNLVDKFKLDSDSEILICVDQHHSNILPWQRLAEVVGCKIVFFGILPNGRWDLLDFESKLSINTKVIAISNVSNVLGVVQDVGEMNGILDRKFFSKGRHIEQSEISYASMLKSQELSKTKKKNTPSGLAYYPSDNTLQGNLAVPSPSRVELDRHDFYLNSNYQCLMPIIVLDATQAVSHFAVDVKELGVDFMVFSGHKVYGPTGVGVLYGRKELLEVLPSYRVGGDMVESVTLEKNIYKESPFRFEAGTANFASIIGLKAALDWFIRSRDQIFEVEDGLFEYLIRRLEEVEWLEILGGVENVNYPVASQQPLVPRIPQGNLALTGSLDKGNLGLTKSHSGTGSFAPLKMTHIPLISFNIKGVNSLDLALMLDQKGICVRSGQHCAGILHEFLKVDSSCRISLACFNSMDEIDYTIKEIKNAIKKLK